MFQVFAYLWVVASLGLGLIRGRVKFEMRWLRHEDEK